MRCCVNTSIRQHERNSLFYRLDFLISAFLTVQFYERSWIERVLIHICAKWSTIRLLSCTLLWKYFINVIVFSTFE